MLESRHQLADLKLVPAVEGPFFEVWPQLRELESLFIPVGTSESKDTHQLVGPLALCAADSLFFHMHDMELGLVYTDRRLLTEEALFIEVPTRQALAHFFFRKQGEGVGFNCTANSHTLQATGLSPSLIEFSHDSPLQVIVDRVHLARLLGLLETRWPEERPELGHSSLGTLELQHDKVFSAFHHAVSARGQEVELDEHFFTEITALLHLRLYDEASNYLQFYSPEVDDPRYSLVHAHCLSLSGKPQDVYTWLEPLLEDETYGADAYYELAFSFCLMEEWVAAMELFEDCLSHNSKHLLAHLGLGMLLRDQSYRSRSAAGLEKARGHFGQVVSVGGYHTSEALHHLATISIALEDWEAASEQAHASLSLRDEPKTRRNLCIALHACGRKDEAYEHYRVLQLQDSPEAGDLARLFS